MGCSGRRASPSAPLLENLSLLKQAFEIANSNVDDSVLEEYQESDEDHGHRRGQARWLWRLLTSASRSATRLAYNAFLKTLSKGVGVQGS